MTEITYSENLSAGQMEVLWADSLGRIATAEMMLMGNTAEI